MRESQQAHLLSQYVERLKHDPDATPPAELNVEMAVFARQLVESQNHRRARVWSQVLAEVKHDSTASGRLAYYDEPKTMTDPNVFHDYHTHPQTQKKRQTFPLTLVAAMLVLILGITVMIAIRNLPQREEEDPIFAAQITGEQVTPMPSLVPSLTPSPIVTPFASIELMVHNPGDLDGESIEIRNYGTVLNLSGWTLRDSYDAVYTFSDMRIFSNGTLTVHSGTGTDSATQLYWGLDQALFDNRQNSIVLANAEGNVAVTIGADAISLQPTTVPTMTPPQLCNVQALESGMLISTQPDQNQSALAIATLPENVIAQVFEQALDERGTLWYHIRVDVEDARIVGWVNAANVREVGESCPRISGTPLIVTAMPAGRSGQSFIPTEDLTELLSAYDYLPVVIAGMDIPEGTQITENMVAVVYMPVATVQDMVSRNGTAISGVGTFREAARFAIEDISRWQPLFMSQIAEGSAG